jgi:hypothetical protein
MLRRSVTAIVALAVLAIGIGAVARGKVLIGVFFVGIGLLRAVTFLWRGGSRKPQSSIRLNIEDSPPVPRPPRGGSSGGSRGQY